MVLATVPSLLVHACVQITCLRSFCGEMIAGPQECLLTYETCISRSKEIAAKVKANSEPLMAPLTAEGSAMSACCVADVLFLRSVGLLACRLAINVTFVIVGWMTGATVHCWTAVLIRTPSLTGPCLPAHPVLSAQLISRLSVTVGQRLRDEARADVEGGR